MDFRKLIVYLSLVLFAISAQAVERKKYNFNSDWLVTVGDVKNGESVSLDDSGWKRVTLSPMPSTRMRRSRSQLTS